MSKIGETIQIIEEMYINGKSIKQIAKLLDTSYDFVESVIKDLNSG
jgi:transposase